MDENQVWGLIMLVFLLFPFVVSMIGILVYTPKKFGVGKALMLAFPAIFMILRTFHTIGWAMQLLTEEFYAFSVSYGAIRTLSSRSSNHSQTIFQLYFHVLWANGQHMNCSRINKCLNFVHHDLDFVNLWHILGTFLASKAMGVSYRVFDYPCKNGWWTTLEPVRRNRIRVVNIDFNPDEKQFAITYVAISGEKQSSVEE